jgi:hypothetical protein
MVFKRIATVFLWLLVTLTSAFGFMASELEIASSDFFYETIDCAESETPGTRNLCRENGWLNYDTTSGYCVATNKTAYRAIKPEFTQSTLDNGFYRSGVAGRLGNNFVGYEEGDSGLRTAGKGGDNGVSPIFFVFIFTV